MRRLIDFLLQNPILLFVVVAWIAGMIGNLVKAARKSRERAEQQRRMPQVDARREPTAPTAPAHGRPAESDVAAEMRRILGMDPAPPPRDRPRPAPPAPVQHRIETERPPAPVVPTTQRRRLALHEESHVGERIQQRHVVAPARDKVGSLGSLGGRVTGARRVREIVGRYPRTNLRQALVLSEVLGPPLALRPPDPARLQ